MVLVPRRISQSRQRFGLPVVATQAKFWVLPTHFQSVSVHDLGRSFAPLWRCLSALSEHSPDVSCGFPYFFQGCSTHGLSIFILNVPGRRVLLCIPLGRIRGL